MGHYNSTLRTSSGLRMLKGKVGNALINKNDLVQIAERGKIYPVVSKIFSDVGDIGVVKKAIVDIDGGSNHENPQLDQALFDQTTQSAYALLFAGNGAGNHDYWSLIKVNEDCNVQANINLNISANKTTFVPRFDQLSNGNIAVARDSSVLIFSPDLIQIATPAVPSTSYMREIKALSGGGFALAHISVNNLYLRIHANNGNVIYAGLTAISTSVNSSSSRRRSMAIEELSNGNIVIFYQLTDNTFQYTVISPVGVTVIAPTALTGISSGSQATNLKLAIVNGYFCCAVEDSSGYSAVVVSNTGVVRNYRTALSYGVTVEPTTQISVLMTDGVGFWIAAVPVDTASITNVLNKVMISYISTSGNNADNKDYAFPLNTLGLDLSQSSTTNFNLSNESGFGVSAFLQNNVILLAYKGNRVTFDINNLTIDNITPVDVAVVPTTPACFAAECMVSCGNGVAFLVGGNLVGIGGISPNTFLVEYFKYVPTAILGVAQTTIAAGNENSVLNVNASKGQLSINPIPGGAGGFDFTATKRRGQKGIFSFDSVIFNDGL